MRSSLSVLSALLLSLAIGCSGPGTTGGNDTGIRDSGATDAGALEDTGTTPDTGADAATISDSGSTIDAFTAPGDAGACVEPGLGDACGDTAGGAPCPTGFDCDLGRCLPQGRETCGGFAGAPCTDPVRSECLYETGHGDVGTCFSPSEVRCLCATDSARWCPS